MQALSNPSVPTKPPLVRIVDEGLGAILAPERHTRIVDEALTLAGLEEMPGRPTALAAFVEGALFSSLSRHLEVSEALELVSQLRATMELALKLPEDRSSVDVRERITFMAQPARALVATQSSLVFFLLQDVLGERSDVSAFVTPAELRHALRGSARQPLMVVVDRKHAGFDLCLSADLSMELDSRDVVVWWGADQREQAEIVRVLRGGPRVIACDGDLCLADLGALCFGLLDGPG